MAESTDVDVDITEENNLGSGLSSEISQFVDKAEVLEHIAFVIGHEDSFLLHFEIDFEIVFLLIWLHFVVGVVF